MVFHLGFCPDQRLHLGVESVRHEFKFAVGRDEGDGAVVFEARQPDTLVELNVFHFDRFPTGCCGRSNVHEK